jgi:hypothetical protein
MQADLISAPTTGNHTTFLSGPPGTGKTTLAVQRLRYLLEQGIPAEQILILVPQRTLAVPYYEALRSAEAPAGSQVDVATVGGLARRTLELFWPLVAGLAGFAQPNHPPRFLTLETAQYYLDRVVEPFVGGGAFDGITIPRARLVSQIIDNLNKAAAVGFPPHEIAARLKSAWSGDSARLRIYDQVQAVALAFRRACLTENLLDWSLQIEVFQKHLLPLPQLRRYLLSGYRHLIVDNTEEDIPASHDLLRLWLPLCESALVVHDTDGGYRVFLGADPAGALVLGHVCQERIVLSQSHVTTPVMAALGAELAAPFLPNTPRPKANAREALRHDSRRFHPQMLDWVAEEVSRLVLEEGLPPGEIAILAPFLSDALRFSLGEKLTRFGIPVRTHRPSRQLREEPAARCLLTLAKLAHPAWRRLPPAADVAHAFLLSITDLDPIRARLLTDIVYRVRDGQPALTPFHQIVPDVQERISYLLGGRYDELQQWLQGYTERAGAADELDYFLSRLFGEVLSQPGFGFHHDFDAGAVAANLIESIQKFRQSFSPLPSEGEGLGPVLSKVEGVRGAASPKDNFPPSPAPPPRAGGLSPLPPGGEGPGVRGEINLEYLDLVERGVVAAQYVSSWSIQPEDAVLLVPAYTFLMMNRPVAVQFWLDAGSRAWFERIYQPLTHPYVLRRDWDGDQVWADEDEVRVRQEALGRLILGLTRRCRQCVYLALSELNERGYEQQGPLLQAVQRLLRQHGEGRG